MQSFVMALRSIGANKMRAVLTMLGIIIGVMALVVLVSLVSGTTDSVTGAVSDLGTSLVTVTISDDKVITVQTKNCLGTACYRCQMSCPAKVYQYNKLQLVDN